MSTLQRGDTRGHQAWDKPTTQKDTAQEEISTNTQVSRVPSVTFRTLNASDATFMLTTPILVDLDPPGPTRVLNGFSDTSETQHA